MLLHIQNSVRYLRWGFLLKALLLIYYRVTGKIKSSGVGHTFDNE